MTSLRLPSPFAVTANGQDLKAQTNVDVQIPSRWEYAK